MKKFIYLILTVILAISVSIGILILKSNNFAYCKSEYNYEVITKGLKNAEDFCFDSKGNIYVSTKNKIIKINSDRTQEVIFEEMNISIKDIAFKDETLFYLYDNKLNSIDLTTKKHTLILDSIPSYGNATDNKLLVKDNELYLAIAAATNSAVVSSEDKWALENGLCDLTPKEFELNGSKFEDGKTSAFSPYGKTNNNGDKTSESNIGNASIIKIDTKEKSHELVAYGLKEVLGFDFNSEGYIFATVKGMEDKGARPLYGDSDYIYSIDQEETWYGWPDYSGGDPVDSVRFRKEGKKKQSFVLENHPTESPKAPLYQHDKVDSLGAMAIDREGVLAEKDSMFIYDKKSNSIFNFYKNGAKNEIVNSIKGEIETLKIQDDNLYVLDNKEGYLIKFQKPYGSTVIKEKNTTIIISGIVILLAFILFILVLKNYLIQKKK